MRLDVTELMSFYQSPLGGCAVQSIMHRVSSLWGNMDGLDVLGVGYAPPYLSHLEGKPRRIVSIMPAAQGAHAWQARGAGGSVAMADEHELPFPDAVFDRILVIHALEETSQTHHFLREIWRVSAPEARIIVVTPNRSGLWAVSESTPFGIGRPYSRRQLKTLLRDALIEPTAWTRALYTPPVDWKLFTSSSEGWERIGELVVSPLGGANLIEGVKHLRIDPKLPQRARTVAPAIVPKGLKPALREKNLNSHEKSA